MNDMIYDNDRDFRRDDKRDGVRDFCRDDSRDGKRDGVQDGVSPPSFVVRAYTKKELALMYFPDVLSPHTAVNRMMAWVRRCQPLAAALYDHGEDRTAKWLTPRQVRLIVEYLGEP